MYIKKEELKERDEAFANKMKLPSRMDLVKYGFINFIILSIVLILAIYIQYIILSTSIIPI